MTLARSSALLAAALATLTLAACATDPNAPVVQRERPSDDQYVTGSNIPKKKGQAGDARSISREELDRIRDASGAGRSN
jgi:hypothetical protein